MSTNSGRSASQQARTVDRQASDSAAPEQAIRPVPAKVLYEQPLNERIRTFLRLEYLFKQAAYHLPRESEWDSRATLNCILEILDIFGNTNLKSETLKELERHSASLKRHAKHPDIDQGQLNSLLDDIHARMDGMHQVRSQIANDLKANEFLISVRKRSAIPGGTCDFDIPAFHYWLKQPSRLRTEDLSHWLGNFDAIGQAIQLILRMTRDSSNLKPTLATGGVYQRTLDPNRPCQLVRIALPPELPLYAELSGGRHRFTARFMQFADADTRARQTDKDIEFELACCII